MVRRVSSPQKKKRKYRRRYLRRVTSPVIMRNYRRFNPPVPPERSGSNFSYDFVDEFDMFPQRHTTDDFVEISPPIHIRPVYREELPINPGTFTRPSRPLTYSERRYQEATDRVLRLQKEEQGMITREAFSIYPERGEAAKMLRNRYVKEREREIRDEEEEEFLRSERRRQLIKQNYRIKKRDESLRRMAEIRRRTSPIIRPNKPSENSGVMSKIKGFFAKKSPAKKSSGRKSPAKKSSGRKSPPKKSSGRKSPPKKKSSRRTSPVKRPKPKKKRKARVVDIEG